MSLSRGAWHSTRCLISWVLSGVRDPLSGERPGKREILLAGLLLGLLATAIYLPHVIRGGWYLDDWIHVALMHEADGPFDVISAMGNESYRPGLVLSLSLFYAIAGEGQAAYLAIGAFLAGLQGWLFFLVLRNLRLHAVVAGAGAFLFVVLPIIDASRLWMSAFPIQVAGALFLAGLLAALHGLNQADRTRAMAWHGGAAILYFASMLTYELVAGLIIASSLLYAVQRGRRAALRRFVPDFASVVVALAIIAPRAADDREAQLSLGFLWDRSHQILAETEMVFRWLLPSHHVLAGPLGVFLLMAGILGAGIAIGRGSSDGVGFSAWAKIAGLSAVFTLAGLVMLLPADPYFVPRISGLGNRTSAFAAFGMVLLLVALIVLAIWGVGSLLRRPEAGLLVAVAFVVATGLNLTVRELHQQEPWADSWQQQQEVMAALDQAVGKRLRPGIGIVSFRHTTFILPADVSVFAYSWDLRGAVQEVYEQPDVAAHPWVPDAECGARGVVFTDGSTTPSGSEPFGYEKLLFVDIAERRSMQIRSRRACEARVTALTTG